MQSGKALLILADTFHAYGKWS